MTTSTRDPRIRAPQSRELIHSGRLADWRQTGLPATHPVYLGTGGGYGIVVHWHEHNSRRFRTAVS